MRQLPAAAQAALDTGQITVRDFIRFVVRDRDTGADVVAGFWSDVGPFGATVINPETQAEEVHAFEGAGELIGVGPVPLVSNLSVQTVEIELSQVSDANTLVRQYDAKQGRVEVYRGLFEANTLTQVSAAYPRFFGFIDEAEIITPAENEDGGITLSCVSHTQELTRDNPATRSDAYQRQRNTSDSFRRHSAVVGTWEIRWGAAS